MTTKGEPGGGNLERSTGAWVPGPGDSAVFPDGSVWEITGPLVTDPEQIARDLHVEGHAEAFDSALFDRQMRALYKQAELREALSHVVGDLIEHLLSGWLQLDAGSQDITLMCAPLGLDGSFHGEDIVKAIEAASGRRIGDIVQLAASGEKGLAGAREVLGVSAMHLFRVFGVVRGPCKNVERCGVERWIVAYRAPSKHGGRRPISETLCPACEVAHLRARRASYARANRRKQGGGDKVGRPPSKPGKPPHRKP